MSKAYACIFKRIVIFTNCSNRPEFQDGYNQGQIDRGQRTLKSILRGQTD